LVLFADRVDAGRRLARLLDCLRGQNVVVLGLPRGGVPVAFEVAEALDAPLDVLVVRKLGVPSRPELAMGAISEGGGRVVDADVLAHTQVTVEELSRVERRERARLDALVAYLRQGRDRVALTGRIAVIVDDGLATGSTARVACQAARELGAARVVLAVPVGPAGISHEFLGADKAVCAFVPRRFVAVGYHYGDFSPPSEAQVMAMLAAAGERMRGRRDDGPGIDVNGRSSPGRALQAPGPK
jgi:putative phosphoribosyl transferase